MELGMVIKTARLARHWTQEELAVRLGLARPTISNWERGRQYPRRICLRALARVLEMNFGDNGGKPTDKNKERPPATSNDKLHHPENQEGK